MHDHYIQFIIIIRETKPIIFTTPRGVSFNCVSAVHGIFQYPVHVYAIYLFIIVCCEYCKNNVNLFLGFFFHENDIILL